MLRLFDVTCLLGFPLALYRLSFINHQTEAVSSSLFLDKTINHFLVIVKSGFGDRFPTEYFQYADPTGFSHLGCQGFIV